MDADPLILTLALDPAAQAAFDRERQAYFPPALNKIAAHVTLFHHLPGAELDAVAGALQAEAEAMTGFAVDVVGPMPLGRGVAYRLRSETLEGLRGRLAARFSAWLTPQDRQKHRPHVTIQNKVAPDVARALHDRLAAGFQPYAVRAEGLALWRYRGGPWTAESLFPFAAGPS